MIGSRYGRLIVEALDGRGRRGIALMRCQCDCGTSKVVAAYHLVRGDTVSCGCWAREKSVEIARKQGMANRRHGESSYQGRRTTPEFNAHAGMMARCFNPDDAAYGNYGGRGIRVCERWAKGEDGLSGYECFLADMGRRPSASHSIDRRENSKGYSKSNCRWATKKEQSRNRRGLHVVEYSGVSMPLSQACEEAGLSYWMVKRRIYRGWSTHDALTTPCLTR
jgi:hypothetical protein